MRLSKTHRTKHILPKNIVVDIVSVIVEILVIIGLIAVVISTANAIISAISVSMLEVAEDSLENALLLVVFIEIYLSMVDFFDNKGNSTMYIVDAALSFVVREVIIQIIKHGIDPYPIVALSILIGALALSRFIVSKNCKTNTLNYKG